MGERDALLALVASLLAILGYMARHYFRRVERHLRWNHQIRNWVNELHLRLARVERRLFGEEQQLTRDKDADADEEP